MALPLSKNGTESPSLDNIQGLILRPFGMTFARHIVLSITKEKEKSARAFLGELVGGRDDLPQITPGTVWTEKPRIALAMGLTYQGVKVLGLDPDQDSLNFPKAFREGAVDRAEIVGDTDKNAPEYWVGNLQETDQVHILLSLYAQTAKEREDASEQLTTTFVQEMEAGEVLSTFDSHSFPDGKVHFGYTDGIANPNIEYMTPDSVYLADDQPLAPPGEFFLGYPNQFNTDNSPAKYKVPQPDILGMDGSYGVFRLLQQDVKAFNKFLKSSETKEHDADWVAAKLVGRWKNGNPLVLSPNTATPAISKDDRNKFSYIDTDPTDKLGLKCPIGAHIRRTNPRDETVQGDSSHDHRIMRRAMPYGPRYQEGEREGLTRGLVGYFIGGDIGESFEFVMNDWVNNSTFTTGLKDRSGDPILSNNKLNVFNIPVEGSEDIELKVPQFVFTKGSAYCFLPSISAIHYISKLED